MFLATLAARVAANCRSHGKVLRTLLGTLTLTHSYFCFHEISTYFFFALLNIVQKEYQCVDLYIRPYSVHVPTYVAAVLCSS
jgi:hypothetical protein